MYWIFFGLFALFFAFLLVVISRPVASARRSRQRARQAVIAFCLVAVVACFVLFAVTAATHPADAELVEKASSPGNVYLREASAQNLAWRLDTSFATEIARRAGSNSCACESMGVMRECYEEAYGGGGADERCNALLCMQEVGGEETAGFMEAALQEDESAKVRAAAASGLGEVGDGESIPILIQALMSEEEDSEVVGAAGDALACFGGAAVDPLVQARCGLEAGSDLGSRPEEVLISIGEPAALPVINQLGTANSGWAEYVLAEIGEPAKQYLQAKIDLEYGNWNMRCATAIPLLQIEYDRNPEKIGNLINYLKNRDFGGAAQHVAIFYSDFINLGIRGTEYFLIDALNAHATVPMAEDYLNCGNSMLDQAARTWAYGHGYIVVENVPGPRTGPTWGGGY